MRRPFDSRVSRRSFVASCARTLSAACGGLFLGSFDNRTRASALNEIRIGVVGCGGRGTNLVRNSLRASKLNRLVAMGDVFQVRLDNAVQALNRDRAIRRQIDVPPNRKMIGFDAYQRVIDAGVDCVFFATPAAFRPLHFSAAVQAGKHSYLEKPLAADSPGVRKILAANKVAERKQLNVSCGLTHRHSDRYNQLFNQLRSRVSDIKTLEIVWVASNWGAFQRQPSTTELEYQIRNFRRFTWLGGGPLLERQIHAIDNCNWLMNAHPVRATGEGKVVGEMGPDHGDIFDYFSLQFRYPSGAVLESLCASGSRQKRMEATVRGNGWHADMIAGAIYQGDNKPQWQYGKKKDRFNEKQIARLFADLQNGKVANEAAYSCDATWTTIMGRMAAHLGREVTWQETIESNQAFASVEFTDITQAPPVLPDKFGDYSIPGSVAVS